jgi:hypothetical protein
MAPEEAGFLRGAAREDVDRSGSYEMEIVRSLAEPVEG